MNFTIETIVSSVRAQPPINSPINKTNIFQMLQTNIILELQI